MNLEELKDVDVAVLGSKDIPAHVENILQLERSEVKEYLIYGIDKWFEEDDNPEQIDLLFNDDKLKEFYVEIMESDEKEQD